MLSVTQLSGFGTVASVPLEILTDDLVHWYKSDVGVTDSSGVTEWADQVGGRDLTESTNKPALVTGQIDGYSSIRFDGSNDKLQDSSGNLNQPVHVFMVINLITWANAKTIFGESSDFLNPELRFGTTGTPAIRIASTGTEIDASIGDWHLIDAFFSGSASYCTVDGTGSGAAGNVSSAFTGGISLANRGASFSNVEFAEVAIYSSEQTSTDLATVEAYFAGRYPTLSIS